MVTEAQVKQALATVMDPELGRNVIELGMLRDLKIYDHTVEFTLALTIPSCPLRDQIAADARAALKALDHIENVVVTFGAMTEAERSAVFGKSSAPKTPPFNHIGRVIAIASGKGGVGKSSVTALLAVALARAKYRVGILDADITGPSIPKVFGLRDAPRANVLGIVPPETTLGIKVISVNLLLPSEDEPVVWRGPIVSQVIQQFWNEVVWGDLDYLLVDLPPGTSDAPLTVMQALPLDGMILVTTPQELVAMVVRKAWRMANDMKMPILGIVENMSGFLCPTCGTRHELFGKSHTSEIADAPVLARLPIAPDLVTCGDAGEIEKFQSPDVEALSAAFLNALPLRVSVAA